MWRIRAEITAANKEQRAIDGMGSLGCACCPHAKVPSLAQGGRKRNGTQASTTTPKDVRVLRFGDRAPP